MSKKITIVAAVGSVNAIVLYLVDGGTMTLSLDDYKTQKLMDKVIPKLAVNSTYTFELEEYSIHAEFENKSNSFIRFFRVAKASVLGLFGHNEENPAKPLTVEEIETHGSLDTELTSENDTVVAVVENPVSKIKTAIPQMETLEKQIQFATTNSTVGMEKFLNRMAKVVDHRGHSMQDLLRFMEKADLPIADDGTVIAYKVLRKKEDDDFKGYVDCHSRRIKQQVGSRVYMPAKMVDPSRRNECSHGLHIARRGYVGNFSGDVCVICKIAPEDFIAVPHNDPNKVRVSGYHIIAELSKDAFELLKRNTAMTDNKEASELLAQIIKGNHDPVLYETIISDTSGLNIAYKVTPAGEAKAKAEVNTATKQLETKTYTMEAVKPVQALDISGKPIGNIKKPTGISPKEIRKKAEASVEESMTTEQRNAKALLDQGFSKSQVAKDVGITTHTLGHWMNKFNWEYNPTSNKSEPQTKPVKDSVVKEQSSVRDLYDAWQSGHDCFDRLVALKRKKKKSWSALKFNQVETQKILDKLQE